MNDKFWSEDLNILFHKDRVTEFYPTYEMDFNEKLNSFARFFIYLGIIISIYKKTIKGMVITLVFLLFSLFLHQYNIEDDMKVKYTMPTENNPYMNFLPFDDPKRPRIADVNNPEIKKLIEQKKDIGLYKDATDPYDTSINRLNYHTRAVTSIIPDTDTFARWIFNNTEDNNTREKTKIASVSTSVDRNRLNNDTLYNKPLFSYSDNLERLQKQNLMSHTRKYNP